MKLFLQFIGVCTMLLSGVCTLGAIGIGLSDASGRSLILIALLVGIPPFCVGYLFYRAGSNSKQGELKKPEPPQPPIPPSQP